MATTRGCTMKSELPTTLPKSRMWLRWIIVLLVGIAGIVLHMLQPIWFAPPLFATTPLIYDVLAFAWLPLWLVLFVFRRSLLEAVRRVKTLIALIFVGMIFTFAFLCSSLLTEIGGPLPVSGGVLSDRSRCTQQSIGDDQFHYTCNVTTICGCGAWEYRFVG